MLPDPVFRADNVNLLHSTTWRDWRATFVRRREDAGVSLWTLQELSTPGVWEGLEAIGLEVWRHPRQYGIAYDPEVWRGLHWRGGEVGPLYGSKGGGRQRAGFVAGTLQLRGDGRRLRVVSAHPPSGVQTPSGPSDKAPNRVDALKAVMRFLERDNRRRNAAGFLAGLDDNVDESRQPGEWPFMRRRVTGLTQVQPPRPTHGRRRIDPFFVDDLRVGPGETYETAGDHDAHSRPFTFL